MEKFFSEGKYIFLPSVNKPKVILNIENKSIAINSYKLYNPFSLKAKILKYFSLYFSYIFKRTTLFFMQKNKGEFVKYLENRFNIKLISSIYVSTDKNKIILQLQSNDEIIGYCKVGVNELGMKRLENEKLSIDLFKDNFHFKVPKIIESGKWNSFYYLIFEPIEIKKISLEKSELQKILKSLYKSLSHPLNRHPRIIKLYNFFKNINYYKFIEVMDNYILNKSMYFKEVYEHGDFAPWNISKYNKNIYVFDFELFNERGIEKLDFIKYYFQIFYLLKKRSEKDLLKKIVNLKISNIEELMIIFLLSEIKNKIEEKSDFSFYENLLDSWIKNFQ